MPLQRLSSQPVRTPTGQATPPPGRSPGGAARSLPPPRFGVSPGARGACARCPLPRPGFHFPSARATAATSGPLAASGAHGRDALGARGVAPGLRLQLQQLPAHRRRLPALLLGCRHLPVGRLGPPPPAAAPRGRRGRRLADARPAARARARRETGGSRPCPALRRRGRRRVLLGPARPAATAIAGGCRGPGAGLQPGLQNDLPGRPPTTT